MSIRAFEIAKNRVEDFNAHVAGQVNGQVLEDHQNAMECLDCEADVRLGIEAYQWTIAADLAYRKAAYDPACEWSEVELNTFEKVFHDLVLMWLDSVKVVLDQVNQFEQLGYHVEGAQQLTKCEQEFRAIAKSYTADELPEKMAVLQDAAIQDHRNGKTSSFFSE